MADEFINKYKALASIPEVSSSQILQSSDDVILQILWSTQNLAAKDRTISKSLHIIQNGKPIGFPTTPLKDKVILNATSEDGTLFVYIIQDDDKCYLLKQVALGDLSTIDLKDEDIHGKVPSDPTLSSICISPDNSHVAYIAEKKRPKFISFLNKMTSPDDKSVKGDENLFVDDWGEQMEGISETVVVILNMSTGFLKVHTLPEGLCGGQIVWHPSGRCVVGTAFNTEPYRLGLIFCANRESHLFSMDLDGKYEEITCAANHVQTPRFSPDGNKLIFLRSLVGGPHVQPAQMVMMDWTNKQESVLVDYVDAGGIVGVLSFRGLCGADILPLRCWSQDSRLVIVSAMNRVGFITYAIDTNSKKILEISLPEAFYKPYTNIKALDFYNTYLIFSKSATIMASQVYLAELLIDDQAVTPKNIVEVTPSRIIDAEKQNWIDHWDVEGFPRPDNKYPGLKVPTIYSGPKNNGEKCPLIFLPHGGPHSAASMGFNFICALFVECGYAILMPNFKGSLGQGRDGIYSLPGLCGTLDVNDCYLAMEECFKRHTNVDMSRVFLWGGSHGGFLITHLIGQYPALSRATTALNPVTDLASMSALTDIIDWTFVESGLPFEHKTVATKEDLARMLAISPISHIDNVKTPTLFLIGKKDKRVPPSQGIKYHQLLKARNIETKLYLYDDNHSLSKVDVQMNMLVQSLLWFKEHGGL